MEYSMETEQSKDNKTDITTSEDKDGDIYKIEEIKIEEMAIDGICGVY
jgi:mycofactocin precursor